MKNLKIVNFVIGNNYPVFIIAEAGIHHNGSFKIAKKMVNVDEIIEAMTNLNQKPSQEVVSLMKEYTNLLLSFTNKIKTINKNGKFVTENEG